MYEYKVLAQKYAKSSGKLDREVLETTLNRYAAEGWRLAESFVAANPPAPVFSVARSTKAQIVVILERSAE